MGFPPGLYIDWIIFLESRGLPSGPGVPLRTMLKTFANPRAVPIPREGLSTALTWGSFMGPDLRNKKEQ